MYELKDVSKIYQNHTIALNHISLKLPQQGFIFIKGKSGSGKTTLLNILGCLDKITSGTIFLKDENISNAKESRLTEIRKEKISFIFQDLKLFENLTVEENGNEMILKDSIDYLDLLEIKKFKKRKIKELSGGQKQRVAIARALNKNPDILLCDEPTGFQDKKNTQKILNILKAYSKTKLVLVISHELECEPLADQIIEMKNGSILKNNIISTLEIKEEILPKSYPRFNLKKMFKFSINFMLEGKSKIILSTIILSFALFLLLMATMLSNFDRSKIEINSVIHEKNHLISIEKKGEPFAEEWKTFEIEQLKEKPSFKNLQIGKKYYRDGFAMNFSFLKAKTNETNSYYDYDFNHPIFFSITPNSFELDFSIIGEMPKKANEILITQYLADYIIEYNIKRNSNEFLSPKNYENILKNEINFSGATLKITGILQQKLQPYESLKNIPTSNLQGKKSSLFDALRDTIFPFANFIYVSNDFEEFINDYSNKSLDQNIELQIDTFNKISTSDLKVFSKKLDTYDGEIIELKENEIIVSSEFLEMFRKNDINNLMVSLSINHQSLGEFIIKGISKDDKIYLNESKLSPFITEEFTYQGLHLIETNEKNLSSLWKNDLNEESNYLIKTVFTNRIEQQQEVLNLLKKIFFSLSFVFVLFSFLILWNYIDNTISIHQNDIAILKSLGVNQNKINWIFKIEIFAIGTISILIAVILSFLFKNIGNEMISESVLFSFHPITISWIKVIVVSFLVYMISNILCFLTTIKNKKKLPQELFQ